MHKKPQPQAEVITQKKPINLQQHVPANKTKAVPADKAEPVVQVAEITHKVEVAMLLGAINKVAAVETMLLIV